MLTIMTVILSIKNQCILVSVSLKKFLSYVVDEFSWSQEFCAGVS